MKGEKVTTTQTTSKPRKNAKSSSAPVNTRKRLAKGVRTNKSKSGSRNDYLATLADPVGVPNVKIPDTNTMPSATFQTTIEIPIVADSQGNALVGFAPRLQDGGLAVGMDVSGNTSLMFAGVDNPLAFQGPTGHSATSFTTVPSAEVIQISNAFSAVRAVSMQVDYVPTLNALRAEGSIAAGCLPREQLLGMVEPVGLVGVPFSGIFGPGNGAFGTGTGGNGPQTLGQFLSSPFVKQVSATQPMTVLWKPEDERDWDYQPTLGVGQPTQVTGGINAQTTRVSFPNAATGNTDVFLLPFETYTIPSSAVVSNQAQPYTAAPYIAFALSGGSFSQQNGICKVTINWEAIPVSVVSSIVSASPSPNNPLELAQASNVVTVMPDVMLPTMPNDPGTRVVNAISAGSSHLYDGTNQKDAISGRSIFDSIGGVVENLPWTSIASGALSALFG